MGNDFVNFWEDDFAGAFVDLGDWFAGDFANWWKEDFADFWTEDFAGAFEDAGDWITGDFADWWANDFVDFWEDDFVDFWEDDFVDFWEDGYDWVEGAKNDYNHFLEDSWNAYTHWVGTTIFGYDEITRKPYCRNA